MNSDVDQMHIVDKKVVPSKAEQGQWAIRLARKWDWELPHLKCPTCFRCAWRIGSSCFEGQRSDGKGSATYNGHHNAFRWWTSICSHWRGKVSWISCPSSGDLELEEVTIRVWRVSRRCQKTWREPPPSRCGHTGTRPSFERSIKMGEGWPYFSTHSVLLLFLSKARHWVPGLLCIWFLATSLSLANLIFF